jgi:hypothetical protein
MRARMSGRSIRRFMYGPKEIVRPFESFANGTKGSDVSNPQPSAALIMKG